MRFDMYIRLLITVVLAVPALWLALRYNIHMFQLNGYKNGEHIHWLKKHLRLQWILVFSAVWGMLCIFVHNMATDIFSFFVFALIILVYRAMKHMSSKKKLVYTHRVKRLIFTMIVLCVASPVLTWFLGGAAYVNGIFLILVGSQLILNVLANIINRPIEYGVNRYYINDAKKMLRSVPDIQVIGVTGSYGKTSVKFYLQTLLQSHYSVLVTPESFNTPMGVVRTIREKLKPTHQIFICEMGARHVGDIKEICDIVHPKHGIITSIGPQHLETFFTMQNIQATKFELADALPEDGMLFLNGDNQYIQEKAKDYERKVYYHSEQQGQGYYAKEISVSQMGTDFTVVAPNGDSQRYQMKLVGMHNVINVVGAIAVAHSFGIGLGDLRVPVRRLQPVEHRMQLREQGAVTIIDDAYNSNPVGSKAAVETLALFDGVRILITPGMVELGEKEEEYNFLFGGYAAGCCDYMLFVGKKHTEPIQKGALEKGFPENRCKTFQRVEDALSYAYQIKSENHKYILLENDLPDNY